MAHSHDFCICTACGTQFDTDSVERCNICDDPRQFVPPSGQAFTTLGDMKKQIRPFKNVWKQFDGDDRFWSIWTEPKFAIGQRAILIKTPVGNVLWDCITYLDKETEDRIKELGGLVAIVISHPHYYTTHVEWAKAFKCPVYLSAEDKKWLNRFHGLQFITAQTELPILHDVDSRDGPSGHKDTGVKALKLGGHFPGSLVCLAHNRLLVADTLVTTPSGLGDWGKGPHATKRAEGMNSYAFMWSIPNMIPLSPEEIVGMWSVLKKYDFASTHGAFVNTEVEDGRGGSASTVKQRVLESMQIQVRRMGWSQHAFLDEV